MNWPSLFSFHQRESGPQLYKTKLLQTTSSEWVWALNWVSDMLILNPCHSIRVFFWRAKDRTHAQLFGGVPMYRHHFNELILTNASRRVRKCPLLVLEGHLVDSGRAAIWTRDLQSVLCPAKHLGALTPFNSLILQIPSSKNSCLNRPFHWLLLSSVEQHETFSGRDVPRDPDRAIAPFLCSRQFRRTTSAQKQSPKQGTTLRKHLIIIKARFQIASMRLKWSSKKDKPFL